MIKLYIFGFFVVFSGLLNVQSSKAQKTELRNLGPEVNTPQDESAPVITSDAQKLYFWSLERPGGYGFQDIYVAEKDTGYTWHRVRNIGQPLSDAGANILLSISPDGQRLLVYSEKAEAIKRGRDKRAMKKLKPKKVLTAADSLKLKQRADAEAVRKAAEAAKNANLTDLALVGKDVDRFAVFEQLRMDKYIEQTTDFSAYLAADGKTLLLSMIMPDGQGQDDLYVSFYDEETHVWSAPRSLGAYINTSHSEITPFLAPDGITLYYSSNSPEGLGGYDVYKTQRLDSTWRNWTTPKNLGSRINGSGNEYHFKFAADADVAYLMSTSPADTSYGGKDIYWVKLQPEDKPKPVVLVKGRVLNQLTKQPVEAYISYLVLPEGNEVGGAHSDPKTGEYTIILPAGFNYTVLADGEGFIAVSENLNVEKTSSPFELVERDLYVVPVEKGQTVLLNNLFYETGKFKLKPDSKPELERLVLLMELYPNLKIEIAGHTDNVGAETVNKPLSENRAKSVLNYLIERGVAPSRVIARGYGSAQPKVPNKDEKSRAMNRRVEFRILEL
jgi:outer membrane protein OmpA-like peptidoglycan-associated protein